MTVERYGQDNVDDEIIAHKTWRGTIWETWKIYGRSGNDRLIGGFDNDYLYGEAGNDTLMGSYDKDQLYGGDGDDTLYGHDSHFRGSESDENDFLDGGRGADRMYGGTGDDAYVYDNVGDRMYEQAREGIDLVISFLDFSLGENSNLENLRLEGNAQSGFGNALSNEIEGNNKNNSLHGMAGYDTLSGFDGDDFLNDGEGIDTLKGGNGNDTLVGQHSYDRLLGGRDNDVYEVWGDGVQIVENSGEGIDTVVLYGGNYRYTLAANVENLRMTGSADSAYLYGNNLNNEIVGEGDLYGYAGNDTLKGSGFLHGGEGNDTLIHRGGFGAAYLRGSQYADTADIDVLRGGGTIAFDRFVLGDESTAYYSRGSGYAIIENFDPTPYNDGIIRHIGDKINLNGRVTYEFRHSSFSNIGSSAQDTGIYLNGNLIAIVADYANLSYASPQGLVFEV